MSWPIDGQQRVMTPSRMMDGDKGIEVKPLEEPPQPGEVPATA
jgi:hypothetical protein